MKDNVGWVEERNPTFIKLFQPTNCVVAEGSHFKIIEIASGVFW